MKRQQNKFKFKRAHLVLILLALPLLYLFLAYEYFYLVHSRAKIPWPDNQLVYHFNDSTDRKLKYVALGDSLTYGFGAESYEDSYTYGVANHLSANGTAVTLNDLSYPGHRSDDVRELLNAVRILNPDVVTLCIGVNDAHQLVETSDFEKNYDQILYQLTHTTKAKIYVINIPYLGPASVNIPPFNYYFDAKTRAHNEVIEKLAAKYNLTHIDLYGQTVDLFKKDGPHYSRDRYHPSAEGYKIWARIVQNDIRQ